MEYVFFGSVTGSVFRRVNLDVINDVNDKHANMGHAQWLQLESDCFRRHERGWDYCELILSVSRMRF